MPDDGLVAVIRRELALTGDPARAKKQQAYMKSSLPFFGVGVPEVRRIARGALREHPVVDRRQLEAIVRQLFDEAGHREEWYAALELWAARAHARFRTPALVPLLEHVVVTGAWWDVVDDAATHVFAPTLSQYPDALRSVATRWARHDDLWLRRTALLSQIGAKDALDVDLLADVLEPNLAGREFFARKAVGWALRDAARTAPGWVREYLDDHAGQLAPLSLKEASRHLDQPSPPGVTGQ